MVRAGHGSGWFSGATHAGSLSGALTPTRHLGRLLWLAVDRASHLVHHTLPNCASGCSRAAMWGRSAAQRGSAYNDEPAWAPANWTKKQTTSTGNLSLHGTMLLRCQAKYGAGARCTHRPSCPQCGQQFPGARMLIGPATDSYATRLGYLYALITQSHRYCPEHRAAVRSVAEVVSDGSTRWP